MSTQQVQQRPSAANGVGRRRSDRDVGSNHVDAGFRSDSQNWRSSQGPARSTPSTVPAAGSGSGQSNNNHYNHLANNNSAGSNRSSVERVDVVGSGGSRGASVGPLHDRLRFMSMCLIGQAVDVQVKNGSTYSGIFHTANVEKDFGIVLKMVRLTKDGSVKGGKSDAVKEAARKAPQKTLIIHAKDFVQIIAKDVSLSGDIVPNGRSRENRVEIVTDSVLSHGRQRDSERELKPWKPDDGAPRNLGLDSTFQSTWNRNWDQFETNKALFGVETTFNEELYTTKLERGPQMREREREAWRIAREIEGQSTRNLHLAEERGIRLAPELEAMDEESRFSSVIRGREKLDAGEDGEDRHIDEHNEETFGGSFAAGGASSSPSESAVSTPVTAESDNKPSRPSSADSSQTVNGSSQKDPSLLLRDRRASSIEKGELAILDSQTDTHREHLRLRHLLVGDKSKRSNKGGGSPYHSPVGRGSPLMSPLVGDPAAIQALNLDPSCPQVPEDVYREFHEFKLQETAKKGKKQREDQVNELKSFSESLKKKELEPRSPKAVSRVSDSPISISSRNAPTESGVRPSPLEAKSSLASAVPAAISATAPPSVPLSSSVGVQVLQGSTTSTSVSKSLSGSIPTSGTGFELTGVPAPTLATAQGASPVSGLPVLSPAATVGGPPPITVPTVIPVSHSSSYIVSPTSSSSSSVASGAASSKKSILNPHAKEFKLNPNAKAFTPSLTSPRPASPMIQGPVYLQTSLPPVAPIQGVPVGLNMGQYIQQPGQPSHYAQYNNAMATAAAVVSSPPYMQPPGGYISGIPGAGPVLPVQPSMKMPPHSQLQLPHYGQQQPLRYPPQGHPMQPAPAYLHGQLSYPPQMMYGQPGQVLYIQQFPQGMMQGQPVPPPPQGPLPPQPSQQTPQQKHRGGGIQGMHYSGAPPYLPGQHHLPQPQISHIHSSLQPTPGGIPPASMPGVQPPQGMVAPVGSGGNGGGGNGIRVGGKVGAGSFQQQ